MENEAKKDFSSLLEDLEFSKAEIKHLTNLYNNKDFFNLEIELNLKRKNTLKELHANQNKLEHIDFIKYKIKKENKNV